MSKKIHVIGGSGFIGTRLVQQLSPRIDVDVDILDKRDSLFFPELVSICDIRVAEQLREVVQEGAVLVNLAAEHRDDVRPASLYQEVNVRGAQNICNIAEEKNIEKIIFTSSVAVYGFAPVGTDESGKISPFNEYGRTKFDAEEIFKIWQAKDASRRSLVIIRPTVVFGERNRGNVFNLLRQIASGRFVMVGTGSNRKSMAYVGNVVAFIEFCLTMGPGVHIYNYADKPDFTMNSFVGKVRRSIGRNEAIRFRIPFTVGYLIGIVSDVLALISRKNFSISAIRVKKFCSNSVYESSIARTGFVPPIPFEEALERTISFEFLGGANDDRVFFSE